MSPVEPRRAASEASENAKSTPGAAPTGPVTPAPAKKAQRTFGGVKRLRLFHQYGHDEDGTNHRLTGPKMDNFDALKQVVLDTVRRSETFKTAFIDITGHWLYDKHCNIKVHQGGMPFQGKGPQCNYSSLKSLVREKQRATAMVGIVNVVDGRKFKTVSVVDGLLMMWLSFWPNSHAEALEMAKMAQRDPQKMAFRDGNPNGLQLGTHWW
ncbi:TPA: hypothetical protein ACH3X1_012583 [Trebouxia sp. C0004]